MSVERTILIVAWILTILALLLLVPRKKFREAQLAFLVKQVITWSGATFVVEKGWIQFPVRELSSYGSSFTYDFFVHPALCAIFIAHYPEKRSILNKVGYYALFCSGMTLIEVMVEKNTNLIKYTGWTWYWTWIGLFITFVISRLYVRWYCKLIH